MTRFRHSSRIQFRISNLLARHPSSLAKERPFRQPPMSSPCHPVPERAVHDLLDLLYQAATPVDGWGPFLGTLADFTQSDIAVLMAYDARNEAGDVFAIHGADDVVEAQYAVWTGKNLFATTV